MKENPCWCLSLIGVEGSLPCWQELATGIYAEVAESSPQIHILFKIHFNISLLSMISLWSGLIPAYFLNIMHFTFPLTYCMSRPYLKTVLEIDLMALPPSLAFQATFVKTAYNTQRLSRHKDKRDFIRRRLP